MIRVPASVIRAAALFSGEKGTLSHVSVRGGESSWDVCATDSATIFRATNGGDLSSSGGLLVDVSRLAKQLRITDGNVTLTDVGGGYVRADVYDRRRMIRLVGEMLPALDDSDFPEARSLMPSSDEAQSGAAMIDPKYMTRCCKAAEYMKSSDLAIAFAPLRSVSGRREEGKLAFIDLAPRWVGADARALVMSRRRCR